jgi:hypothetical protein
MIRNMLNDKNVISRMIIKQTHSCSLNPFVRKRESLFEMKFPFSHHINNEHTLGEMKLPLETSLSELLRRKCHLVESLNPQIS